MYGTLIRDPKTIPRLENFPYGGIVVMPQAPSQEPPVACQMLSGLCVEHGRLEVWCNHEMPKHCVLKQGS